MRRGDYSVKQPLLFIMHLVKSLWIFIPRFTMCESCNERSLKTVELIIDNSSEFNIELHSMDYHRNTPLDGAKNCGNLEIVEVLKQKL